MRKCAATVANTGTAVVFAVAALIATGCGDTGPTGSTGNSSFRLTGEMVEPRMDHAAALLPDGRVLIAGGTGALPAGPWGALSSAEVYDPVSGRFTRTGSMPQGRVGHVAIPLPDGTVLVAGGGAREALIYDPASEAFREGSATVAIDGDLSAGLMSNGTVFLMSSFSDRPEIYDPATGRFTRTSRAGTQRFGNTVTAMADGSVALIGGGIQLAEEFDPAANLYRTVGAMLVTRFGHAASRLQDGRILITGGSTRVSGGAYAPVANAEIYDPASREFAPAGDMAAARFGHTSILLQSGDVLITGGSDGASEVYRVSGTAFEILRDDEGRSRTGSTATLLPDGRVLIAGGLDGRHLPVARGVIYSP